MTEVLAPRCSRSRIPSPPSSVSCAPHNDGDHQNHRQVLFSCVRSLFLPVEGRVEDGGEEEKRQLSLLAILADAFRKSLVACRAEREELRPMEIGWPTDVQHVAHVTFDRFDGFLGLPVELEPEVPRLPPSASANVFGVSASSMQCSYDSRGNSVPTILLLMQNRLYIQGGLQAEGIFRINADNGQEEYVRGQLNRGIVPGDIDIHCLAGLIKAWFRELPGGLLDSLTPEQVMQCQSEEDYVKLSTLLPSTEASLLDWAINLMADTVQEEQHNKMNAHNVATVFAPNMTQMVDPLTALMHAVRVMKFLKALIMKALKERKKSAVDAASASHPTHSDENGHHSPSFHLVLEPNHAHIDDFPPSGSPARLTEVNSTVDNADDIFSTSDKGFYDDDITEDCPSEVEAQVRVEAATNGSRTAGNDAFSQRSDIGNTGNSNFHEVPRKVAGQYVVGGTVARIRKPKRPSIVSCINSRVERVEAWR